MEIRYALGFTSPIGKDLQNDLNLSSGQNSFFGACANLGAMAGALMGGYLADRIGRRLFVMTLEVYSPFANRCDNTIIHSLLMIIA